jgi:hypothetical protein
MFLGGLGTLLVLAVLWQFVAPMLLRPPQTTVPTAITVASLDHVDDATGISIVLGDQNARDIAIRGELVVELRTADGSQWRTVRNVTERDFAPLPSSSLFAGRLGYWLTVPNSDWARPPRRGALASVVVSATPQGRATISTSTPTVFP